MRRPRNVLRGPSPAGYLIRCCLCKLYNRKQAMPRAAVQRCLAKLRVATHDAALRVGMLPDWQALSCKQSLGVISVFATEGRWLHKDDMWTTGMGSGGEQKGEFRNCGLRSAQGCEQANPGMLPMMIVGRSDGHHIYIYGEIHSYSSTCSSSLCIECIFPASIIKRR
jgi:hypothetical protein